MELSVFSPELFYTEANGEPMASARISQKFEIELPHQGFHEMEAAQDGSTSLVWVHGVIGPIIQRDAFIQAIESRALPIPFAGPTQAIPYTRARYIPLEKLQTRTESIASLFELSEGLADEAAQSGETVCASCSSVIPVFHSAADLCVTIATQWKGRTIQLELHGPLDVLTVWADAQGLPAPQSSRDKTFVRLDAFTCDEARCQLLQSLVASTQRLSTSWISVRDGSQHGEYGWHGRCPSCQTQNKPFQRALALEALKRGDSHHAPHEMSRLVHGIPLKQLLELRLSEIASHPSAATLLPIPQRAALKVLNLEALTLKDTTSQLPPQILARLPLAAFAGTSGALGEVRILDSSPDLLSPVEEAGLREVARSCTAQGPVIWLRNPRRQSEAQSHPSTSGARMVGTLSATLAQSEPFEVSCGGMTLVRPGSHPERSYLYHEIVAAVRGAPTDTTTYTSITQCSLHVVPLLSSEQSVTRLLAHELGVIDPLARLFASSQQAKMTGLSAREFTIGQTRQTQTVCATCKGSGLRISLNSFRRAHSAPCPTCWGARLRSPAREVSFKGRTMWELLNTSIEKAAPTLRALPKMRDALEIAALLKLAHLPLGIPTSILPRSTQRLVAVASAVLSATTSRPSLITLEEPFIGFSAEQLSGLLAAVSHSIWRERVAWVGVENR